MGMAAVVEQISRSARDQIGDKEATWLAQSIMTVSTGITVVEEFLTRWCQARPALLCCSWTR
jgi:uncharacterized circularly permuted ATP-grasp superfamily protein